MDNLKLYVIKSHKDESVDDRGLLSFEIPIQAGAALTDQRVCDINDCDGFSQNISDRNLRYSECTAIYWIGNHIDSEYVGAEHYSRRFQLGDHHLSELKNGQVDIITTNRLSLGKSIEADYIQNHYGGDWRMMMEILKQRDAFHFPFYERESKNTSIHFGNINIMKGTLYHQYCEWAFPMVDEFYRTASVKMDTYNRRDAGFIMERLSHFFVERMRSEGKRVIECEVKNYGAKAWEPSNECDLHKADEVYSVCVRLYQDGHITKCCRLLGEAEQYGLLRIPQLKEMSEVFLTWIFERKQSCTTMFEYLPEEMKKDLSTLCASFQQLKAILALYQKTPTIEMQLLLQDYLRVTGFSEFAVEAARSIIHSDGLE